MRREWAPEAINLQRTTRSVLADLGGVDLARAAEKNPDVRTDRLRPALDSIGLLDLDPLGDDVESSAAMLAVKACGEVVAPYPVTHVLAVPAALGADVDAIYLVDGAVEHLEHADVFERPAVVGLADGRLRVTDADSAPSPAPLDPFGTRVTLTARGEGAAVPPEALHLAHVLDAFWVTGALESATRDAARYAGTRKQFGKTIGSFGEIRSRLAEMSVAVDGLHESAAYAWFVGRCGRATPADSWALRLAMLEAADSVLRHAHQVFGAIGLCEEQDLTVIDRHLSPTRLRPCGQSRTVALLVDAIERFGFSGTFEVAPG